MFLFTQELHEAVKEGKYEEVKMLIEKNPESGETTLFNYIYLGKKEMVEFLLKHGADINIKTNRGEMPLHQADIIFHSRRPGGYTPSNELYISFQTKMGTWTEAINMGKIINSFVSFDAKVSPDGKFLFFFSLRDRGYRLYWMDAKIIEELKPKK